MANDSNRPGQKERPRSDSGQPPPASDQSGAGVSDCPAPRHMRRLLAQMTDGYFEADGEGRLVCFNPAFCTLLGRRPEQIRGTALTAHLTPDSSRILSDAIDGLPDASHESAMIPCALARPDGSIIAVQAVLESIADTNRRPAGISGFFKEISEKETLETALAECEGRYQQIMESAPYAISIFSADDWRYIQVSRGFCIHTGYSIEEIIGHTAIDLNLHLNEADAQQVAALLHKDKCFHNLEMGFRTKSGRIIEVSFSARPVVVAGEPCYLSIAHDITPIKDAQRAMQESEQSYRAILNTAPYSISVTRLSDSVYLQVNDGFCQNTGYSREEVIGRSSVALNIFDDPRDREKFRERFLAHGEVDGMEMGFRTRDGRVNELRVAARRIRFRGEECILTVTTNVSDLKQARKAAEEREARYRTILNSAPYGIVINRRSDLKYVEVNAAFLLRTGYSREETIGSTPEELNVYADPAHPRRMAEILQEKGRVEGLEVTFKARDGRIQESLISVSPVEYGGEACWLTITMDINDLKYYRKALKESEAGYRTILESAPYAIVVTRWSDSTYMQVNEAFCRRTGYRREDVIGKTPVEIDIYVDPDARDRILEVVRRDGRANGLEMQFRAKDGSVLDSLYSATPIRFKGEACILAISVDISELKKAQQALRKSEERYRNILANIEEGYWEVDLQGTFTFVNEAEGRLHRCPAEKLIGRNNRSYSNPETYREVYKIFNKVYKTGIPARIFDYELVREDGTIASIELSVSLLKDVAGKPVGFFGVSRDVTKKRSVERELEKYRHRLEEMVAERTRALEAAQIELVKSEKLAVLGQLTATVSHELRNPLGVIRSSNFYLRRRIGALDEKVEKHFRRIDEQVTLCDTIVAELLEYTRGRSVSVAVEALKPWIEALLNQEQEILAMPIDRDLADNLPPVAYDREKMRRVLVNLLENAALAVQDKQESLGNEASGYQPLIRVTTELAGSDVVVAVTDNGIGMAEQTRQHAFEPLFTTRARGTGIGLANVKKIVQEHRGTITLASEPGRGTTVTMKIPCRQPD